MKWIIYVLMVLTMISIAYAGWGQEGWGEFGWGDEAPVVVPTTEAAGSGGGSGGGFSFSDINQLECNQFAQEQQQCLTYNPSTRACDVGCEIGFTCNENFKCEGTFLQPDFVTLQSILSPIKNKELCSQKGYTFFQDSCFVCNGKLVNLKGTIVCMNCKSGYVLGDDNKCVQNLQQLVSKPTFFDDLLKKYFPNNPLLGIIVLVGVGIIGISFYNNRRVILTKLKR